MGGKLRYYCSCLQRKRNRTEQRTPAQSHPAPFRNEFQTRSGPQISRARINMNDIGVARYHSPPPPSSSGSGSSLEYPEFQSSRNSDDSSITPYMLHQSASFAKSETLSYVSSSADLAAEHNHIHTRGFMLNDKNENVLISADSTQDMNTSLPHGHTPSFQLEPTVDTTPIVDPTPPPLVSSILPHDGSIATWVSKGPSSVSLPRKLSSTSLPSDLHFDSNFTLGDNNSAHNINANTSDSRIRNTNVNGLRQEIRTEIRHEGDDSAGQASNSRQGRSRARSYDSGFVIAPREERRPIVHGQVQGRYRHGFLNL